MAQRGSKNTGNPVRSELQELADNVEKAELQARLLEARVRFNEAKQRLTALLDKQKSA
jgi:hypothetical protein